MNDIIHWFFSPQLSPIGVFGGLATWSLVCTPLYKVLRGKWKERNKFKWECVECKDRGRSFKAKTNDRATLVKLVTNHQMQFHENDIINSLKKERL